MNKTTTTTVTEKFDKDGKLTEKVTETRIEEDNTAYVPYSPNYPWNPYPVTYTNITAPEWSDMAIKSGTGVASIKQFQEKLSEVSKNR